MADDHGETPRRRLAVEVGLERRAPSPSVDRTHVIATPARPDPFRANPETGPEIARFATVGESAIDDQEGQRAAFEQYVMPEIDVLYRVARSITRNPTDAEDLVQDTMLRAYRAVGRFDGRYPRAWLLTIMRNAQVNRVRRKRPELLRDPDAAMEMLADEGPGAVGPEEIVVESQFDTVVEEAFERLSDNFREVVELVDIQGLSYQETADLLGIPVGTVMSRLHRARARMRKHLESSGADLGGRRT